MRAPLPRALVVTMLLLQGCCKADTPAADVACPAGTHARQTRTEHACENERGLKNGPGETFYDTGNKRTAGLWSDNKRTGTWRMWRPSGVLMQEVQWREGKLIAVNATLPDCPAGTERRGAAPPKGMALWCQKHRGNAWVNHGPFLSWYDDAEPQAEGSYFAGEPDGEFTMWYADGTLKVRGAYTHGKEEGLFLSWHDNRRLFIRALFKGGKEEGPWVSWWEEGTKSAEGTFHAGLEEGPWTFWHPNGKTSSSGAYADGKRIGWWHAWTADGNAEPMELYELGVRVGTGIEDPPTRSGE